MKSKSKVLALFLALCVLLQICPVSVFAEETTSEKPYYQNFVIFGDSLCLGFSTADASMADVDTYDIETNAVAARYPHAYPTVFGNLIGLDTDYSDDQLVDVYNFGICAAWSQDLQEMLTDPYYIYDYYSNNYDKDTLFTLPKAYTGYRYIVDTEADGYDVGKFGTWQYKMKVDTTADGYDPDDSTTWKYVYEGMEEYTIPAGYKVHVGYESEFYGSKFLSLNPVIQQCYYYVSEKCMDSEGNFIDTNNDGIVDDSDIIYYPTKASGYNYVADQSEENIAEYGKAVRNPKFTKYYYNYMKDKIVNGDLVALAIGGNDIYHSFMPYQQNSGTTLGTLVYWLTYALQMNYTADQIMGMLESEYFQDLIFGSSESVSTLAANTVSTLAATEEGATGAPAGGAVSGIGGLVSQDELTKLLEYYSKENISAYLADVIANYKVSYEASIKRIKEINPNAELVLMGNYNPFGVQNYFTMLAEQLKDGELLDKLTGDAKALATLLQAIIGTPENYQEYQNMSEQERNALTSQVSMDLAGILDTLKNHPNLTDEELTQLIVDLSFPLAVLVMGDGLSDVYGQMNTFLQEMAAKYDVTYVDISNAPTSGRYDPHPTALGHEWIANKLYSTVVPQVKASVKATGTGTGTISPEGTTGYRLRADATYTFTPDEGSKVSAVCIDGQLLDPETNRDVYEDASYTFEDIRTCHCISVQFDLVTDTDKFSVNVVDSYDAENSGAGMYQVGASVTIKAGTREGYEFTGWQADGVELADASAATATFTMPSHKVTVTATWKLLPKSYTLTFDTRDGSEIAAISQVEGSVISLDSYVPTRSGFEFDGWYSDAIYTNKITSVTLNADTTVFAKWKAVEDPIIPETGVETDYALWASLLGLSLLGLGAAILLKKKNKSTDC